MFSPNHDKVSQMNTRNEIVQLALVKFPKARKVAVENVSLWFRNTLDDRMNLHMDTQSYKWNADTIKAIHYVYKHSKH